MVRVAYLMLLVLAIPCGTLATAEPPDEASKDLRGARRLLALPSGDVSVEDVLRILEEEQEALRFTGTDPERWQFEVSNFPKEGGPDVSDAAIAMLAEKGGDVLSVAVRDGRGAPIAFRRTDHALWLDRPGQWRHVSPHAWRLLVDADRFHSNDDSELPPGRTHDVQVDLSAWLTTVIRKANTKAIWDARSRSVGLSDSRSGMIVLRFRSSDDEARYGSVWGSVIVKTKSSYIVLAGFARKRADFFTNAMDIEVIAEALNATEADVFPHDVSDIDTAGSGQSEAAFLMEAALGSETYRRPEYTAFREAISAATREGLAYLKNKFDPERDFLPQTEDAEKLAVAETATVVAGLTKTLQDMADAIANDLEGYPDDPSLVWREAQARYGAMRLHYFLQRLVGEIVIDDRTAKNRDLQASLCDALFDLGEPPSARTEERWYDLKQDPFFGAMLSAHVPDRISDEHREACLAELRDAEAGSTLENLAVEILLRIDEPPPEETGAVDRWWRSSVVEANRGRRLRSLVVLSGSAFGREAIMKRLRAEELSEDVRRDVVRALTSRIDSAEQTGRNEAIDAPQREAWRKELAELDAAQPATPD